MTASAEIAKASVRRLACEILLKVDTKNPMPTFCSISAKTESLTERDRSLLTELVYGTLRWRGKIDAQLSHHLRRPLEQTGRRAQKFTTPHLLSTGFPRQNSRLRRGE